MALSTKGAIGPWGWLIRSDRLPDACPSIRCGFL